MMAPKEKNTIKVSRSYQCFIKTMSIFPSCPTWHSNPCKNGLLHYHSRMIVTIANIILYSDILWHLQSTKECYDYHGNVKMLKYMVPPWQFYHSTFYGNIMLLFFANQGSTLYGTQKHAAHTPFPQIQLVYRSGKCV